MRRCLPLIFSLLCYSYFVTAQEKDSVLLPPAAPMDSSAFTCDYACKKPYKYDVKENIALSQFEPVLSAQCEPLTTVANCFNVVSGHFFQIEKDLSDNSTEPLHLLRYYDSGSLSESFLGFGFGSQFPLWASEREEGAKHCYVMISEREGFMLPYKGKLSASAQVCTVPIYKRKQATFLALTQARVRSSNRSSLLKKGKQLIKVR